MTVFIEYVCAGGLDRAAFLVVQAALLSASVVAFAIDHIRPRGDAQLHWGRGQDGMWKVFAAFATPFATVVAINVGTDAAKPFPVIWTILDSAALFYLVVRSHWAWTIWTRFYEWTRNLST